MNHCLNRLGEKRRREAREDRRDLDRVPVETPPRLETVESLERALASLPDEQRSVLVLREIDGLAYREIAETLSIPIGTVMSRLARARERLLGIPEAGTTKGPSATAGAAPVEAVHERK